MEGVKAKKQEILLAKHGIGQIEYLQAVEQVMEVLKEPLKEKVSSKIRWAMFELLTTGDIEGNEVYDTSASFWMKKIESILLQYRSKADLDVFNAARNALQYDEEAGVPVSTLTHLAEIIAYCERAIQATLREEEERKRSLATSSERVVAREGTLTNNILSTLDSVKRSEVAE